ncbi:MAG: hypothetical protein ACKPKO_57675, partial [Candidatus Fonsibacter sp.]
MSLFIARGPYDLSKQLQTYVASAMSVLLELGHMAEILCNMMIVFFLSGIPAHTWCHRVCVLGSPEPELHTDATREQVTLQSAQLKPRNMLHIVVVFM